VPATTKKPAHQIGSLSAIPTGDLADDPPNVWRVIDNSHPVAVTVESGEEVLFSCPGMPLPPGATVDDMGSFDPDRPHTIVGPVEVRGAEPGDTLVVEILEVRLAQNYGHAGVIPGLGLLGDEVEEPYIHNFSWEDGATHVRVCDGLEVQLNPFCGILGVMPAEPGEHSTIPPRSNGGNIDHRDLVPGSTLFLPVEVPGALFFAGDGHGAQGDGEVCISGLETAVEATIRLSVDKTRTIRQPQFSTPGPLSVEAGEGGYYGTTGIGPDLYACSQEAVRAMVEYLVSVRGLLWREAYVLCSLAVDLKINEIVDEPNWVVSAYLPQSVFTKG
jgi:acetamidase/formamidase